MSRRKRKRRSGRDKSNNPYLEVMHHGIVCPNCGATLGRHGRSGARHCDAGQDPCPGVVCECSRPHFVQFDNQLVWRRSPCPNARCLHCGWTGVLRSPAFERVIGFARCDNSSRGEHLCIVQMDQPDTPGHIKLKFSCQQCDVVGYRSLDPYTDISWVKQ